MYNDDMEWLQTQYASVTGVVIQPFLHTNNVLVNRQQYY